MLETLTIRQETRAIDWPEDVSRMKAVLEAHGYTASDEDIAFAWESHSESVCAGWLRLPDDDEVLFDILMGGFDRNNASAPVI